MSDDAEPKVAPDLEKKLEKCGAEDLVRVIGVIRPSPAEQSDEPGLESGATSRVAYREALLRAQAGARAANAQVLQQVRDLGLEPRGGEATGVFSVEASKADVRRLLDLEEIASLSLDKEIVLQRPSKQHS